VRCEFDPAHDYKADVERRRVEINKGGDVVTGAGGGCMQTEI